MDGHSNPLTSVCSPVVLGRRKDSATMAWSLDVLDPKSRKRKEKDGGVSKKMQPKERPSGPSLARGGSGLQLE